MRVEPMMKTSDFLSPDRVLVDVRESDKVRLLERLSSARSSVLLALAMAWHFLMHEYMAWPYRLVSSPA
jgi:hypothetical protein